MVNKIIPVAFMEGARTTALNKQLRRECTIQLLAYPEADREKIEDDLYPRFSRVIESLLKCDEFKWLTGPKDIHANNEFVNFETDGVQVDLFVTLAWRIKQKFNILRVQHGEQQADVEAIALEALYFNQAWGQDLDSFEFWNLSIHEEAVVISKEKIDLSVLLDVRDKILETRSLLNNERNDFPFTKDMALCQSCKYMSLCERYE
ncbi:hypothetical protein PQO03_21415 [Lentisphaera profundi]|uniref:PD-(D/E)XK endonuclease-like domain-containing protein n=1 Tax=Lentisphaera profundi TaxID=1658616 RepID=A0ABY7VVX5_9BACT|nr:hypothetical protein [Lentisphaera profundi]WDE98375.1 hypothetical protein PQO03_21415 [Lentisphaera profundi]